MTPAERPGNEPLAKHRFPKGFHRGQELFGQHAARLREPGYHEFIAQHGLVIVEGVDDVIGLDNLRVPALGIMSNTIHRDLPKMPNPREGDSGRLQPRRARESFRHWLTDMIFGLTYEE